MTPLDPRTPVIVGAGQLNDRDHGSEPIALMTRCVEAALADTGAIGFANTVEAVRVVWGVWPYADPGRLVAERIGAKQASTTVTTVGGNQVYDLVNDTAARIANGQLNAAIVCSAETLRTRRSDRARGTTTTYLPERDQAAPDEVFGPHTPLSTDIEKAAGIETVVRFYAMAETALRHRLGESVEQHRSRIAELWARASAVAAGNPAAWSRDPRTATEIATESASNRPVSSPYPKLMTSNLNVDQGGAVVMCSVAAARAAGIPRDRWVFPWGGGSANDHWYPTNRWAFDESPAMRLASRGALANAHLDIDACELIDLYSCFPIAVQVAQRELGIDPARPFTITGGLTFAAGPLNSYCMLPLTRAVALLRQQPDATALLTGNGGMFTEHSAIVLAARPAAQPYRHTNAQADVDRLPRRADAEAPARAATLETYTVAFDREMQPERAVLACLDAAGSRHWANSTDPSTMTALLADDLCGQPVGLEPGADGVATAHLA